MEMPEAEAVIRPEAVRSATFVKPVNVGAADMAKVVPVPVWEAMAVAFPTEVIGPVKLAFVVTVAALPEMSPAITFSNVISPEKV